jgi:hypothetical protein
MMQTENKRANRSKAILGSAFLIGAGSLIFTGCGSDPVQVYTVKKEGPSQVVKASVPVGEGRPHLHWTLPAGWQEKQASGMRAGHLTVATPDGKQADVIIVPLPGLSGIEILESVNIWRRELELAGISEEELSRIEEPVRIGEFEGGIFEMVSEAPLGERREKTRTIGAILPKEGTTWFFKLSGDDTLVAREKNAFMTFLTSIEIHEGDHHSTELATGPASDYSPAPRGLPAAAPARPDWKVPAHWEEQPAQGMRFATFRIPGETGPGADLSVTQFPGEAGGILMNINRWRGELGLSPLTQTQLAGAVSSLDLGGQEAIVVNMAGAHVQTGNKQRTLAAIVPQLGLTWFYKMTGDDDLVARQETAFTEFVKSAHSR